MYTSNIDEIIARLSNVPADIEKRVSRIVMKVVHEIDMRIHPKTPVWSGAAVRNMIWTRGKPNQTEFDPVGSDGTGEQNRAANTAAARQSLHALTFDKPFAVYYLTNNAKHIRGLEAGLLPYPGKHPVDGMFGMTYAEVVAKLGSL
ncbi:hypothetical protein KEU06_09620 [Pseudaminobacter sp. 19-2017]|uniref:Uncharacterized protein n=1 Tax=Pseudaminobacter soli (ex Zhang et al. 2022) TaxID=2831468 RepID=A0A942DWD5_9HYPH|nr:hypothetical protein [Pseudaminobacter soli]MBS3648864.1 hypothetical protein [Pseudaminobacter soli]